jgi:hypothetical protein
MRPLVGCVRQSIVLTARIVAGKSSCEASRESCAPRAGKTARQDRRSARKSALLESVKQAFTGVPGIDAIIVKPDSRSLVLHYDPRAGVRPRCRHVRRGWRSSDADVDNARTVRVESFHRTASTYRFRHRNRLKRRLDYPREAMKLRSPIASAFRCWYWRTIRRSPRRHLHGGAPRVGWSVRASTTRPRA